MESIIYDADRYADITIRQIQDLEVLHSLVESNVVPEDYEDLVVDHQIEEDYFLFS